MKILTSSSLSRFRQCPRRYVYEYELKRVPLGESDALAFGKVWHLAMEAWWGNAKNAPGADADANAAVAIAALRAISEHIKPDHAAMLMAMLTQYDPQAERFEIMAIESSFETPIENPDREKRNFYNYRLAGKADLVLRDRTTDEVWIADHKTTTQEILGFGTYWQTLQIDGQMSNYCLAFGARGFIYDVARKPGIRLCGKDEKAAQASGMTPEEAYRERCAEQISGSPEEFFQWREHLKTGDDLADARSDLWQQVEMFRSCDNAGRFPRNPDACVTKYGTCPYIDVCTGRANLDDDSCFRTKKTANEELAEDAA